jgi:hypothetical protein
MSLPVNFLFHPLATASGSEPVSPAKAGLENQLTADPSTEVLGYFQIVR